MIASKRWVKKAHKPQNLPKKTFFQVGITCENEQNSGRNFAEILNRFDHASTNLNHRRPVRVQT